MLRMPKAGKGNLASLSLIEISDTKSSILYNEDYIMYMIARVYANIKISYYLRQFQILIIRDAYIAQSKL